HCLSDALVLPIGLDCNKFIERDCQPSIGEHTKVVKALMRNVGCSADHLGTQSGLQQLVIGLSRLELDRDVGVFLRVFADRGLAIPLDKFVAIESDWKDQGVAEAVSNIGSVGGKTIAIPFSLSTPVLVFNNQLVAAAGGDPADLPTTWDGIFELAKKISTLEPGVSGFYMEYFANGAFGFQTLLFSQNGRMMNANETDIAFDSPQGLAAMTMMKQASDAGMIDLSTKDGRQAFVGGKIGIYEMTSSTLAGFEKQIGSQFSLTMTSIPLAPGGKMPTGGNGMVMLTKDPARQEAAWKYMKFAASPKAQAIMAAMTGYVPINKAALSDPELQKLYQDSPNYTVPFRQLKDLTAWYAFPGENSTKVAAMINSKMQLVLKGKLTPQEALGEAAKEARNLILNK
ncbi:extracellular solute-binding protein, partial [Agrobacterium tumefaciens]|uniref:extracellular solute-binding protein n=1 Tax=Agrobacterium tumefaciens TaxID=358 RepID=UPI001571A2A3